MNMNTKANRNLYGALMATVLLVGVVLACSGGDETDKANKLVDEGNTAINEGKKYLSDAEEKKDKMLRTDVSQLAEARTLANESIRIYQQAEDKCKDAVTKFEEASKLKINDKFKDYLSLKVKEYNKRAELVDTLKSIPQALIDSQTKSAFTSRGNAATEKAERLNKEAQDLSDQADKVQKDNPDAFKK